jgi:MoaA/NifB/PqqE/SkfB family radical SAM enzyme
MYDCLKTRAGPDGVHLFSRTTGTNVLLNEISVPAAQWSLAPRQVSIALTNACDLSCPYCYAPKYRAHLKYERLTEWLNELDSGDCFGVGFGGGEPTLYRDFARLCKFVSKHTRLATTFTTHAHRLDDRLAAELKGHVHFIRVSMDGVGATYEALRGKAFDVFRRKLELIRELAPFGINFVVNASTFPDIDAAVAVAAENGASEFLLLPERATPGRGGIDGATREALRQWVSASCLNVRLGVSEADAAGFPTCDPLPNEKGLRSYAHIDASGALSPSSFDKVGVPIGPTGIFHALDELRQISGRLQ